MPAGVTSLQVEVVGAAGGDLSLNYQRGFASQGYPWTPQYGLGDIIDATIAVVPGQQLNIGVGAQGANAVDGASGQSAGGYGGIGADENGGNGGAGVETNANNLNALGGQGGGGGGASDIRTSAGVKLVVAFGHY